VPARSNQLLLVGVSNRDGNVPTQSVFYAGRALTRLGTKNAPGNQNRVEVWYLVAAPAGTANVVVSLAGGRDAVAGALSFTGIDQATPFGALAAAAGQTASACVTLPAASAPLAALFVSANGDADAINPGATQVVAWRLNTGTSGGDVQSTGATTAAASGALCQSLVTAKPWSMMGVRLNPALVP
jgi:hypothetical protein